MGVNYLFLCLFGISGYFIRDTGAREAIVRGTLAKKIHQFPYQVSLLYDNRYHRCGGGIVSDYFVISVANCFIDNDGNFQNKSWSVLAGSTLSIRGYNYRPPAVVVKVTKVFVPTEYKNPIVTPSDIAILMLKHSLDLSRDEYMKPLKLPHRNESKNYYVGKTAVTAGFGWHWYDYQMHYGDSDGHLRFADALVLSEDDQGYRYLTHSVKQICAQIQQHDARSAESRGACEGDIGNPLVYDNIVIGVLTILTNHPLKCSEKVFGSIYTSVSYYRQFIEDSMNYEHEKHHDHVRLFELPH